MVVNIRYFTFNINIFKGELLSVHRNNYEASVDLFNGDKIVVVDGGAVLSPADPEKFSESSHSQNN